MEDIDILISIYLIILKEMIQLFPIKHHVNVCVRNDCPMCFNIESTVNR